MSHWWKKWRKRKANRTRNVEVPPAGRGEMVCAPGVHQLHPSEPSDHRNFNFDIILFHSLQSAGVREPWESTWVSPGAGPDGEDVCWPAVWLPEDLGGIRVLSVSYEADATKYFGMENTDDEIEDIGEHLTKIMKQYGIGQRRFVLVGHGFGGLVIKSLLSEMKRLSHIPVQNPLDAGLKSTAETFLKRLEGIVYYAVPHRDIAAFFKHLESNAHLSRPLGRLKSSSKKMEKLSITTFDAFNNRQICIRALIEGECTNGEWVVPPETAMLEAHNHHFKLIDCNHIQVCKPPNKQHMSYLMLLDLLKDCGAGKDEEPPYPLLPANLLGIEENMTNLVQMVEMVSRVGVVGVGGIGKTTLVKEFYRQNSRDFEGKSILLDVYKKDILSCQRDLLRDIVKDGRYNDSDPPRDREHGKALLRKFLPEKRVLIVLDDVASNSVDDLVPKDMKLHPGSKIILTSRDWSNVKNHVGAGRLDMQLLADRDQARKLFCLHAFEEPSCSDKRLEDITEEIVGACGGLPLSLEVVGSFLCKKQEEPSEYWKGVLRKLLDAEALNGGVDEKLWSTLKISFDDLAPCERGKFLDVACFFCESEISSYVTKEKALIVWDSQTACVELQNLIDRHLVAIDENGFLKMHDQLRAMGRSILKTDDKYNYTRISDKCDGLKYEDGEKLSRLEGLHLANKSYDDISTIHQMKEMHKLCILIMENCDVQTIEFFNNLKLKQLRWVFLLRCSIERLPSFSSCGRMTMYTAALCDQAKQMQGFEPEVGLPTKISSFQLPLTTLDFSSCKKLEQLPHGIGNLRALTSFRLWRCSSLKQLPHEIGNLTALTSLNLSGCSSLEQLPHEIGNLTAFTSLELDGCSSLEQLPHEIGNLKAFTSLKLDGCSSLEQLPHEVGNLMALTSLDLHGCSSLAQLPHEIGNLTALTSLDLRGCSSLAQLPHEIGNLTALTSLDLHGCSSLAQLPHEIGNLMALTSLTLWYCSSLKQLPHEIGNLMALTRLELGGCKSLEQLPHEIGNLTALTRLDLHGCKSLVQLPHEIGNLTALTRLDLDGCSSLAQLPHEIGNLTALTRLNLHGCSSLAQLPHEIGNLMALTSLKLQDCSSLEQLPHEIGNLTAWTSLDLHGCSSLAQLPHEIGNLMALTSLTLWHCSSLKQLPHEIGNLMALTSLELKHCSSLEQLPHEIGNLMALTRLDLHGCSSLVQLPHEIGNLTALTRLDLHGCSSLVQLPHEIGNLTALTSLTLWHCSSLKQLPHEIGNLMALTRLDLYGCSSLEQLPHEIGNLTVLTTLALDGCSSLAQLPHEIGNLMALTRLDLDGCSSLEQLPHMRLVT